jgi:hypothetical protein
MDEKTKFRLDLLRNGIRPVACQGKRPVMDDWPNITPTEADVIAWGHKYPLANNTGANGKDVAGLDIDIRHPDAAAACEEAAREWAGDAGSILTRFGDRPKRLIPFLPDKPFPKILRVLKDANGETHRIEFLCDGQQFIANGFNPDAKVDYAWHADRTLGNVRLADLPPINADDAAKLVDHLVDILVEQFGFTDVTGEGNCSNGTNGAGGWRENAEDFDADAALAAMLPDPASVENVQRRVALSWMQKGVHPNEILERLVFRTMEVAKAGGLDWSHDREVTEVTSQIIDRFKYLVRDYKSELPPWLPGEFHVDYMDRVSRGFTPSLGRNRYGFYILKAEQAERKASNGNGHAGADDAKNSHASSAEEPKAERKFQFRLTKWCDMKHGVDPVYLVDELIPVAVVLAARPGAACRTGLDVSRPGRTARRRRLLRLRRRSRLQVPHRSAAPALPRAGPDRRTCRRHHAHHVGTGKADSRTRQADRRVQVAAWRHRAQAGRARYVEQVDRRVREQRCGHDKLCPCRRGRSGGVRLRRDYRSPLRL